MKTALLSFKNPNENFNAYTVNRAEEIFLTAGFNIESTHVISGFDAVSFNRLISRIKETCDNVVILDSENTSYNLKESIAEFTGCNLEQNDNAIQFANAVSNLTEIELRAYTELPVGATLIPNIYGVIQGFIKEDGAFNVIYLPCDEKQFLPMCEKYVFAFLEKKFNLSVKRLTLKYFGDETTLTRVLEKSKEVADGNYSYFIFNTNGDYTIRLLFKNCTEKNSSDVIRYVVSNLKEDIYAESEESLGERLFDILKLKKLKIAVAESFTGGRIVSELIKNSGASEVVSEGIVSYSNESKISRLGVSKDDVYRLGAVSSEVAYQMALGLLNNTDCDVAIATTGLAGPKSDDSDKPVGLCYISVGMRDGIHIYKFNNKGTREQITETAKNQALFLAIKKLKKL